MKDDVPEEVKKRRLQELIYTFYSMANDRNQRFIGTDQLVLVESVSYIIVMITECLFGVIVVSSSAMGCSAKVTLWLHAPYCPCMEWKFSFISAV